MSTTGTSHSGLDPFENQDGERAPVGSGGRDAGGLRLRPPRHQLNPRAVRWWTWQAVITVVLVLAAVIGPLVWLRRWLPASMSVSVAVAFALLSVSYVVIMPRWRYQIHRWETTGEAVYTASGWLWQEWRVAPLSRIQTVDVARGPLQRIFKLSSVIVTTASAAGPVRIEGLDHVLAREVVDQLTEATQATPGDAT